MDDDDDPESFQPSTDNHRSSQSKHKFDLFEQKLTESIFKDHDDHNTCVWKVIDWIAT